MGIGFFFQELPLAEPRDYFVCPYLKNFVVFFVSCGFYEIIYIRIGEILCEFFFVIRLFFHHIGEFVRVYMKFGNVNKPWINHLHLHVIGSLRPEVFKHSVFVKKKMPRCVLQFLLHEKRLVLSGQYFLKFLGLPQRIFRFTAW